MIGLMQFYSANKNIELTSISKQKNTIENFREHFLALLNKFFILFHFSSFSNFVK